MRRYHERPLILGRTEERKHISGAVHLCAPSVGLKLNKKPFRALTFKKRGSGNATKEHLLFTDPGALASKPALGAKSGAALRNFGNVPAFPGKARVLR